MTHNGIDRERMDEAWAELESKLAGETPSPKWAEWSQIGVTAADTTLDPAAEEAGKPAAPAADGAYRIPARTEQDSPRKRRFSFKRYGVAAAAAALAIVVATPAANDALASMLNQFRMQEVVVVQENDLRQLMNQLFPDGQSAEAVNKFGAFTASGQGKYENFGSIEAAEKRLGAAIKLPASWLSQNNLYIGLAPSNVYTFTLNVDEINRVMERLGAKQLLPTSVDGKPLMLKMDRELHVSYHIESEDPKQNGAGASYSRTAVPTIEFDPSVDAKAAYDAVVNFPMLPEHIRSKIVQGSRLEEGQVPMPLVLNREPEKRIIAGVPVYLDQRSDTDSISAIWLKDGYLHSAYFYQYESRDKALAELTELVSP